MKIAVIGIACRYPGARNTNEFFENILAGRRSFRPVPPERWRTEDYYHPDRTNPDTTYCKRAALIENFEFDPAQFRIPRKTFLATDIAQWLALSVAQEALLDANIDPAMHQGTGVIMGNTLTGEISRASSLRYRWPYVRRIFAELLGEFGVADDEQSHMIKLIEERYKAPFPPVNEDNLAGSLSNTIAGRICNYFDFKGGGFSTDGACSSSLLAINQACIGLVNGNCDLALAGGVDISIDPFEVVGFAKVGALSDSDICVYDRHSSGFLPGEGCGIVVLQRYEDAIEQGKPIYAVINGIGISSDGKGGITAPSVSGQSLAVSRAYEMAGYGFGEVELIEGHGTGTPTGDNVELATFVESKRKSTLDESHRCGIGSIKSNIGHTKAAAGVAGFIKSVMSVCYGIMPATQGIRKPNQIFSECENIYPILLGKPWVSKKPLRTAAVSSAGFGGINTHVTLSSVDGGRTRASPEKLTRYLNLLASSQSSEVFLVSANDLSELRAVLVMIQQASQRMSESELVDLSAYCAKSYTAGRLRAGIVAQTAEQLERNVNTLLDELASASGEEIHIVDEHNGVFVHSGYHRPRIAFMFPGQASQYLNMGRRLKDRCRTARSVWESADRLFESLYGRKISEYIFHDVDAASPKELEALREGINHTAVTQPAVTTASLAILAYLRDLGVRPDLAIGHSLGEYAALHSAGVLDLDQTLTLVSQRGSAMGSSALPKGAMLSLNASHETVGKLIERVKKTVEGELVISNVNSISQTTVSGALAPIDRVEKMATDQGIKVTRLPVSSAFHSKLMLKAAQSMRQPLAQTIFRRPHHLLVTPTTGDFVSDRVDFAEMLRGQILESVDFVGALETARAEDLDLLVEVGPGAVLSGLARQTLISDSCIICPADIGDRGQHAEGFNKMVAYLFSCGVPLNIQALLDGRFYRPFSLPYNVTLISSPCEVEVMPLKLGPREGAIAFKGAGLEKPSGAEGKAAVTDDSVEDLSRKEGILEFLKKQIVRDFGYSYETLQSSSKLQDDLGLDSLKSVELAHEVMGAMGLKADASQMQNVSLEELVDHIYDLKNGRSENKSQSLNDPIDPTTCNWTAAFRVIAQAEPIAQKPSAEFSERCFLIVIEQECTLVDALAQELESRGASVVLSPANDMAVPQGVITDCIYLLSQATLLDEWLSPEADVLAGHFVRPKSLLLAAGELARNSLTMPKSFTLVGANGARLWYQDPREEQTFLEAGSGVVKTLHLEHQAISTRCIDLVLAADDVSQAFLIIDELAYDAAHRDVAYLDNRERVVAALESVSPDELAPNTNTLEDGNVVLVTGGGKGITAECVIALARTTGIKLALVGSSPLTSASDTEVSVNLARMAKLGMSARYYVCDVSNTGEVQSLVRQIETEQGSVCAIIHAAGVNGIQKLDVSEWTSWEKILRPKMYGLVNILNALEPNDLKSINVFSSIIANSGMAGNAAYAYANEWMNQFMGRMQAKYPEVDSRAFGFSVWADIGMGKRLNSIELLRSMGIGAIPVERGCDLFAQLMAKRWPSANLIIASRMGQLDTLAFQRGNFQVHRFSENILYLQPGIELVSEVELDPGVDQYLADHVYDGAPLFPAVMGIEAMVQCAVACRDSGGHGSAALPEVANLDFARAITVPSEGRTIRVYVQMILEAAEGQERATIEIRSDVSNFSQVHFSGECVWSQEKPKMAGASIGPSCSFLDLDPQRDLYGKVLFQGPMFRNILGYRELSAKHCVVDILAPAKVGLFSDGSQRNTVVFGSGQVRDTLLHSVQLCVPHLRILPVSIERIVYLGYPSQNEGAGLLRLSAAERERTEHDFTYDLQVSDASGAIVELIIGFKCRIISDYNDKSNLKRIMEAHKQYASER